MRLLFTSKIVEHSRHLPAALNHPKLPRNLGRKPFPMAFGDNFDCSVENDDGGLIVDRIRRYWYPGGPSFYVGQGSVRHIR
jgi:hypothetical protein